MTTTESASGDVPNLGTRQKVEAALEHAYVEAMAIFAKEANGVPTDWDLSKTLIDDLELMSSNCGAASAAFNNIITCLAIKTADPGLDVRVHQVQIGAPFNFRSVSEVVVYPFLRNMEFEGAKSGWQTRTLERPKPYTLDFDENIKLVKQPFLHIHDAVATQGANALAALSYLFLGQIELREAKRIPLARPKISDISLIYEYLEKHFAYPFAAKGASRLPVLALHAIYELLINELQRYTGMKLRALESHSAADAQTGAVGDIEVEGPSGIFEALEVKHGQQITSNMIDEVEQKIMTHGLDRYYLLTTHEACSPTSEMVVRLADIQRRIGCQVVVNGVLPTIKYYLRLLKDPGQYCGNYAARLEIDQAISYEHRVVWNEIVTGHS